MILPRAPFFSMRLEAPPCTAIAGSHRYIYLDNNGRNKAQVTIVG